MGGLFGLEIAFAPRNALPAFLDRAGLLLANARSAIALLVGRLTPGQVWMPSYLCDSLVASVPPEATRLRFYEITERLTVADSGWLEEIGRGDLVISIAYFGFPHDEAIAAQARGRGAWVVKDACQAMFSEDEGANYDFVVFSPRKFVGVPDGGILRFREDLDFGRLELFPPPAAWWLDSFRASALRREFDRHGGSREWFDLSRRSEAEVPIGPYGMSELTRLLLSHGLDVARIAELRRNNYKRLSGRLGSFALFPDLPAGVVPLGFPIQTDARNRVRDRLFEEQIYPAVHWPVPDAVPRRFEGTHRLAARILTLPCDQRYGEEEMDRMAEIVTSVLAS